MSKGIIVVDMPTGCYRCSCSITKNWQCSMNGEHYCGITDRKVSDYWNHEPSLKPDWCPINPMPERKALTGDVSNTTKMGEELVRAGFNACLDEIEGKM